MEAGIEDRSRIPKVATGIPGLDYVAEGGLPAGRAALVSGNSGSGKSLMAAQFLVEGIRQAGESAAFVTFEERPQRIRDNLRSFGWPVEHWEEEGWWAFADMSPEPSQPIVAGALELGALIPRIEHAVNRVGARRLVLDSVERLFSQVTDASVVRQSLGQLMDATERMGVTTVITAERPGDEGPLTRFGVEEFVSDTVILLRNAMEEEKRRRTVEVFKMRGASHQKGEFPFTISAEAEGLSVVPLAANELSQPSSRERLSSGIPRMDELLDGGFLRGSITLVAGPTGSGKTLVAGHFLAGNEDQRSLLVAFEEGRQQILRNAEGWGISLAEREAAGTLRIEAAYPETMGLEDHLVRIKRALDEFQPDRLVLDSASALERIAGRRAFREFLVGLVATLRERGITALMTANTTQLTGGTSATEAQISSMTDGILLLRYIEGISALRRALVLLKMRGANQDQAIRSFTIGAGGLVVGEPLKETHPDVLGQ
ncbi:MAG: circadian clock protein KaiC [Pseudomonadota bacterium]